ncbi:MAG: prolipoprotein diacylglyceryl transferase [Thermodesulfobacteriota bacterium]
MTPYDPQAYFLIDPVLFQLGPFSLRWYGLMYLVAFVVGYFLIRADLARRGGPVPSACADDVVFHMILGVLLGGRIGYVLIYNLPHYLAHPQEVFAIWQGGMSFHGGMIGMIVMGYLYARRHGVALLELADVVVLAAPIGLMFGRLGNFINGELFGRATDLPWGMVFPMGGPVPRHPSQLYQALTEGLLLFLFLYWLRLRVSKPGSVLAAFIVGYGAVRFVIEFFREPDPQLGFVAGHLSMGQVLCLGMIFAGLVLLIYVWLHGSSHNEQTG